jgi:hypothetical protein
MESWPEFVTVEDWQSCLSESEEGQTGASVLHLTGWEAVVFELQDVLAEVLDAVLGESG